MTADRNSSPAEAEMVAALGFERIAEGLEDRGTQLRRMGGNLIMYGEGHAAADQNAAKALRSAASIIAALTAAPKATEAPGLREALEKAADAIKEAHSEGWSDYDTGALAHTLYADQWSKSQAKTDHDAARHALSATPQPVAVPNSASPAHDEPAPLQSPPE